MNNKSLFQIDRINAPEGLLGRVVTAVYQKQQQSRLWRVRIFAGSAALCVVALIPVISNLITAFKTSNFGVYSSLIFTDGSAVASFWKEIVASLVESLPVISIALALALVGVLLWSLQKMVRFMSNTSFTTI